MCARGRVGSRRVVFDEEAKRGLPEEMAFELKEVGGHYIAIWGAVFQDRVPILEGQLESLCGWIPVRGGVMGPVVEDVIGHCRASCCSLSKVESIGRFLVKGSGNRW